VSNIKTILAITAIKESIFINEVIKKAGIWLRLLMFIV